MAAKNADHALGMELLAREERGLRRGAVLALQRELELEFAPWRIEAFDISNIGGAQAVGSMVSFDRGHPVKKEYRRFRIRTVMGMDDYAMMREVVKRRYKKHPVPDLVVIDGGKGQLEAALDALRDQGKHNVQVLGLAKRQEEIYLPGRGDPLRLPGDSRGLLLLRKVRDEAHRFAVSYHRKLRGKRMTRSILDDIPGIGEHRKKVLLNHFGSVKRLKAASVEEIGEVQGIGPKTALAIHSHLRSR
jgi:excinuclease ABC subunit C